MDLNEFIEKALITESTVDTVEANYYLLADTILLITAAGGVLDLIKKNTFYGRPFDHNKLTRNLKAIEFASKRLQGSKNADLDNDRTQFDQINPRLFHSIVGVATESVELLEALDIRDGTLDTVNVLEEYGDIDWYKAIGIDELDGDWEQILSTIIDKLQARYNGAFSAEKANNRDLEQERQVLNNLEPSHQSTKDG